MESGLSDEFGFLGVAHRQRPSHWRVSAFIYPVRVLPGGVTLVSQRERVLLNVWTARVPLSHRVYRQPRDLTSEVMQRTDPAIATPAQARTGSRTSPHR